MMNKELIENFDEYEDIILPDTLWGEIIYIKFILIDTFKNQKNLKQITQD